MAEKRWVMHLGVSEVADILRAEWTKEVGKFEVCEYGVRHGAKSGAMSKCTTGGCRGRLMTCMPRFDKCYPVEAKEKFEAMERVERTNRMMASGPPSGGVEVGGG